MTRACGAWPKRNGSCCFFPQVTMGSHARARGIRPAGTRFNSPGDGLFCYGRRSPGGWQNPVKATNFFAELQRRNVYRVAVAYGVVGWLLVQIATQVFPFFEIPNWATRLVVVVLLLGFPVALIFGWIYELTPEGIKRTDEVEPTESMLPSTGRKLDFVIIAVLLTVIAVFAF